MDWYLYGHDCRRALTLINPPSFLPPDSVLKQTYNDDHHTNPVDDAAISSVDDVEVTWSLGRVLFQRHALTDVRLLVVRPPEADSDDNGYDKEAHDDDYDDEPHFFVKCILVCSGRGIGRWVRYACTTEKAWRPHEYSQCTERK